MKASDYEPDEHGRRFMAVLGGGGARLFCVQATERPDLYICGDCSEDEATMIAEALEQQAIREDADKRLRAAGIVREKPQTESEAT